MADVDPGPRPTDVTGHLLMQSGTPHLTLSGAVSS